ncbi:MAG: hypothetical protein A3F13_08660 [Gammaproteobacteria bacterium RIFCSPHIGHO2_12_FULL_40_19]|nr:MAG: hypothetical protein A3F13_08660 [Gammaproteobacteria bacterium RIFCSPHIGHO2_12_FULL_40_19]
MFKQFGSIYLILGTCIAAGMLGLPVVTAQYHFALTAIMLISSWLLMTTGAWCLLQVNMTMPQGANFISMSEAMFGRVVKYITSIAFLMLLYSLICAYVAASSDLLQALFLHIHAVIPRWLATLLATVILGGIVYQGIRTVDIANRFLMSAKFVICFLLIGAVFPFAHIEKLSGGNWHWSAGAWLVIITSFGYGNILPSIRDYLDNDRKKIMRVFFISSLIPPILYFVWIGVIHGALTRDILMMMNNSANTNSLLMSHLAAITHDLFLKSISVVFISICSITGFLSVSTSLLDALIDGLKCNKNNSQRMMVAALTFLPPMLVVIFDPTIFIHALAYAGICCLYILVALPVAMYVRQRIRVGVGV